MWWRVLAMSWLCSVACTKSEPVAESPACCAKERHAHAHEGTVPGEAPASGASRGSVSLSGVKIEGTFRHDGVQVSVRNHGDETVSLRSALSLVGSDGTALASAPLLRWSCDHAETRCVTLAPGAEYLPPPWPAKKGMGACGACPECVDVTPGRYALVAKACDHEVETRSEPFLIGERP